MDLAAPMTVAEMKTYAQPEEQAVLHLLHKFTPLLEFLRIETQQSLTYKMIRETGLPSLTWRRLNEAGTKLKGAFTPKIENLHPMNNDIEIDSALASTAEGQAYKMRMRANMIEAVGLILQRDFIKNDPDTGNKGFYGLQTRLPSGNSQLFDAGATSGGDALSLAKLDEMIWSVKGSDKALMMNIKMRILLTQAMRDSTVGGGFSNETVERNGRLVPAYNDVPIIVIDEDEAGSQVLPFTEANPGGGAAASTSIYCVDFSPEGVVGLQTAAPRMRSMGESQTNPTEISRFDWTFGFAVHGAKSFARLRGIKDAAVVK